MKLHIIETHIDNYFHMEVLEYTVNGKIITSKVNFEAEERMKKVVNVISVVAKYLSTFKVGLKSVKLPDRV